MKLKQGELLESPRLGQIAMEYLDAFRRFSVRAQLLDFYLTDKNLHILDIEKAGEKFGYYLPKSSEIDSSVHEIQPEIEEKMKTVKGKHFKIDSIKIRETIKSQLRDAFLRCGLCRHKNLDQDVMRYIKNYDDIILAPDTNIFLNCVITSILLPRIEEKINEEIKGCPNWILIAIPKLVMNEMERKAVEKFDFNFPERVGWPTYNGRIGQRALQDILEIDKNVEHRGISLMTIGKLPISYEPFRHDPTRWDSEIRTQVGDFISSISFHKGIFFITQDRVSAMMAGAEGLQSLYMQKPEYDELNEGELRNKDIARVLYEMLVAFGELKIEGLGKFSIFWPEKHVTHWERSMVGVAEVY